jgi:hypothetical protein
MSMQKFRWSKVYESSEEELVAFLQSRGITARRVDAESDSEPSQHNDEHETTIWCAEGSLSVEGITRLSLQPGDAVRIAASTDYQLHPGISGYVYYVSR